MIELSSSPWSVMTLTGHSGEVRCLHLEGNRVASGSTDTTIKVWDLDIQPEWSSIGCKVTMTGHSDTVRCVQGNAILKRSSPSRMHLITNLIPIYA